MPNFGGNYYNPFYNSVDSGTRGELQRRAAHYGARVRSGVPGTRGVGTATLDWSYGKTAYGHVRGDTGKINLGFPGPRAMTDRSGDLTLYNSVRNAPRYPLLQSMDVTNDGTIGSLLRGKFTFLYWPRLDTNGFTMAGVEQAFLIPGHEVQMAWGWSVGGPRCRMAFTGIINNFNWSFNADFSMTTEVSIVSAASLSIGLSGDQSVKDPPPGVVDPAGVAIQGNNLASIIDSDLASLSGSVVLTTAGDGRYVPSTATKNGLIDYVAIVWPTADDSGGTSFQTYWYTSVGRLVWFGNDLIDRYEKGGDNTALGELFELLSDGNTTQYLPNVKSSYPQDVIFPSNTMGSYGGVTPPYTVAPGPLSGIFNPAMYSPPGKPPVPAGPPGSNNADQISISGILLGVNYIKETYRGFIEENAANIPYKNITNFFETMLKRINVASGDVYQFSPVLCDNPDQLRPALSGGTNFNSLSSRKNRAILSIEDTNLSPEHTSTKAVPPFEFEASIFKPIIKNISVSSKPPGPLAAAAFTKARGANSSNLEATVSSKAKGARTEPGDTQKEIDNHLLSFGTAGFNNNWCETYRALLTKLKKVTPEGSGAHWLNKVIYPVDLNITIDGVSGFTFGNVITTNLIPLRYRNAGMVFTVTKVDHKISPGAWETTLHTVSRLNAGGDKL
jgi:hypothetical protein